MIAEQIDCPVCGGDHFDAIAQFDTGGWVADDAKRWSRRERVFDYGACRTCGHVRIVTPYDAEIIADLYKDAEPVFWDDRGTDATSVYRDMLTFCGPALLRRTGGSVVDFGCGHGDLLALMRDEYGVADGIGVDFQRLVGDGVRFVAGDLNRLDDGVLAPLGTIRFAFATHLLEHLLDPRGFLRAVRRAMEADGHLYIEVPDNDVIVAHEIGRMNGLFNAQHVQYWTARNLTALLATTGFAVERMETVRSGYIPRLKILARARSTDAPAGIVSFAFERMCDLRAEVTASILAHAQQGTLCLWGLGIDFHRLRRESAAFDALVRSSGVLLFDLGLAGGTVDGIEVRSPDELASLPHAVVLLPGPADVRGKMRAYAARCGIAEQRIFDPYSP
ncbi:MAG: Methyltransferase type 12 [Rhodospirillales bacterium]|nr:Methyltransferase type 12 [Rhodospirillales bacterium]